MSEQNNIYCPKCGSGNCSFVTAPGEDAAVITGTFLGAGCIIGALATGGVTLLLLGVLGAPLAGAYAAEEIHENSGLPKHQCHHCSHTWG